MIQRVEEQARRLFLARNHGPLVRRQPNYTDRFVRPVSDGPIEWIDLLATAGVRRQVVDQVTASVRPMVRTHGTLACAAACLVRFLLLSGQPIGEPIAWCGPIVMNTQEELRVAFDELDRGTFMKDSTATL